MFKNRSFNSFVGLSIAVLAVLSIGTLAFTHRTPSITTDNRLAPLDWYFSHDHAILDSDNNVVPAAANAAPSEGIRDNQLAPLEWYLSHDHAIFDSDNNVVSGVNIPVTGVDIPINELYSALKDNQLERLEAVAPAAPMSVAPTNTEPYAMLKDNQLERLDAVASAVPAPAALTSADRYMNFKDQQLERLDSAGVANPN